MVGSETSEWAVKMKKIQDEGFSNSNTSTALSESSSKFFDLAFFTDVDGHVAPPLPQYSLTA